MRIISKKHNWITLVLGVILGAYIIMPFSTQKVDENCDQKEQAPVTVSESIMEAVPAAAQEPVERTSYLIEILPPINETAIELAPKECFLPSPTKVFKVLFQHIISPNSP